MKKIYSLVSLLLLFSFAKAQFPSPYCAEDYLAGVEPITSVTFGTIVNTSPAAIGGIPHEDYTSSSTNVITGASYTISVEGNTDGSFTDYIRVFIDWNQNGDFTDAGESYDIGTIVNSTGIDGKVATANISVPIGATIGTTRMRVTKKFNAYQNPCNTAGYGESEDYSLVIIAAAGCTGAPTAGTATGPTQACAGNSFTLGLTGSSVASAIHYQWQKTTIGGTTWTNMLNDTTPSVVTLQGAVGADYRCMVTCTASNISDSSSKISVAVQTANCPPTNDNACDAITLVLDGASDCQNTSNASSVGDPVLFTCSTPNNTTWYKYTPSVSGNVMFTLTNPATGNPLNGWLGVYTVSGTCPGALTFTDETNSVLGSCKSFGGTASSTTSFLADLTAGTEYYFMVDGVGGDTGYYCISMKTPPTPPSSCATNNLPANAATNVPGLSTTFKWTTVATATSYDLYVGTANPPTTLAGNYTTDSAVVAGLVYNTQFYWYVIPKNTGGSATGCDATNVTSFTTGGVPASAANDEPCDAVTLVLDGPTDCRNTAFATTSANETTVFNCSTPNNTLWYKYTPANSGNVLFTITPPATGKALNGWLGVYMATGSCPGGLTFVDSTTTTLGACKSFLGTGILLTEFSVYLTAGTEYYFMIDGVSGAIGEYCLAIKTPPPPPTTCVTNIAPANATIDVPAPIATLKWNKLASATSYDIYFGTANPPTTKIGSSATDSIVITGLAYSTVYNWYVVPTNGGGGATGCDANLTSFTTVDPPPPPHNDECDSAINMLNNISVNATTVSATESQAGEVCAGFTGNANDDVWFMFTAVQNGTATITETPLTGSTFDGVIIAYSGTCGSLTKIGCADATFGGGVETTTLSGLVAGETYYFRIYGYGAAGTEGSFAVNVAGSALPVSITKFTGKRKGNANILSWTTANETNNKGFELQHSATGDNFLPLNFVETKALNGNSTSVLTYQAVDAKPYAGNTYYRLKQVDKNGKTSFSSIIMIKGEKVNTISITDVYPNPANRILNLVVASPSDEKSTIVVTDITGKILQKQVTQINLGNNNIKLDVSNLARGSYMLKVICNNGCNSAVVKFVKN